MRGSAAALVDRRHTYLSMRVHVAGRAVHSKAMGIMRATDDATVSTWRRVLSARASLLRAQQVVGMHSVQLRRIDVIDRTEAMSTCQSTQTSCSQCGTRTSRRQWYAGDSWRRRRCNCKRYMSYEVICAMMQ